MVSSFLKRNKSPNPKIELTVPTPSSEITFRKRVLHKNIDMV